MTICQISQLNVVTEDVSVDLLMLHPPASGALHFCIQWWLLFHTGYSARGAIYSNKMLLHVAKRKATAITAIEVMRKEPP